MSLCVRDLSFSYPDKDVLYGVSFELAYRSNVYLLGQNGSGKSTLFKCMLNQLSAQKGEITVGGENTAAISARALAKKIAYTPQSAAPIFNYSVLQQAVMGRAPHISVFSGPSDKDYEIAESALKRLGIAGLSHKGVSEISGGELQLTLIARALIQQTDIIIMDEPTSSLDYGNGLRIQELIRSLAGDGKLILQSSHDPQSALRFADRVIAISGGKIVADGKSGKVITPALLKLLYGIDASIENGLIRTGGIQYD